VKKQLKLCSVLCPATDKEEENVVKGIMEVLDLKHRTYLTVFKLGRDTNLPNTIFRAVFDRKNI
jgi:hypothetical protein